MDKLPMNISIAHTPEDIDACYPVIKQLRPDINQDDFVNKVSELMQSGYRLARFEDSGRTVAVAGFRIGKNLAWKTYLYVDDLVTLEAERSRGYGSALLQWLSDYAAQQGCGQLHLDSGVQRKDAHRFYQREGMQKSGYHFVKTIAPGSDP